MKTSNLFAKSTLFFAVLASSCLVMFNCAFAEDGKKTDKPDGDVKLNYLDTAKSLSSALKPLMNIPESKIYDQKYLKKGATQFDKYGVKWVLEGKNVFTCDYTKQPKEVVEKIKDFKAKMAKAEKLYKQSVKEGKPIEIKSGRKYKEGWHPKKIAMSECGLKVHGEISDHPRMEQIKIDVKEIVPHTYHLFCNLGGENPDITINAGTGGHRNIFTTSSSRGISMKVDKAANKLIKMSSDLPVLLGTNKDFKITEAVWYEVMIEINGDNVIMQLKNLVSNKTIVFLGTHPVLKSGTRTNLVIYSRNSKRLSLSNVAITKCKAEMKDSWENLTNKYGKTK